MRDAFFFWCINCNIWSGEWLARGMKTGTAAAVLSDWDEDYKALSMQD